MIGMAALSAAGLQLWEGASPDFEAALAVLAGYDEGPLIGQAAGMWFDIMWGATLVGLHQTGAVGRLARAVELADRHGVAFAQELALRLLATVVAESGYPTEAATLAGYSEAHLRQHRMDAPTYAWMQESLEVAVSQSHPIAPFMRLPARQPSAATSWPLSPTSTGRSTMPDPSLWTTENRQSAWHHRAGVR